MKGKITNYSKKTGYGFIRDEDGSTRFFHTSEVKGMSTPAIGNIVEFRPEQGKRGLIAKSIRIKKTTWQPEYIIFGDIKIRLSDIDSYGFDKFEPAPLVHYVGMSKRIEKLYKKSNEIKGDYLYVNTYENEHYKFYSYNSKFDIYEKHKELDEWLK